MNVFEFIAFDSSGKRKLGTVKARRISKGPSKKTKKP
jgi:hypothetical protein